MDLPKKLEPFPDPWEQLPDETDMAYQAFCVYRDAGKNRSVMGIVGITEKTPNQLYYWKKKYNWSYRVNMWDTEIDREYRSGLVKERIKASRETIEIGMKLKQKAKESLIRVLEDKNIHLTNREIPIWAELGVKIERLGLGDSTDNVLITGEHKNDTVERILADPEALKLALQLEERLSPGQTESVEPDDVRESDLEESESSKANKSETNPDRAETD